MKQMHVRPYPFCAWAALLLLLLVLWAPSSRAALQELADADMGAISGQALLLADRIIGPGLPGGPAADSISYNEFTYYRVVLDADLGFNMNIDKLQLGCGGFNEGIMLNSCDLDFDFARFMGTTGIGSDFVLSRPYLELAIKNDSDKTKREVVGLKIGAAVVDGMLSIGRTYANGQTNAEWGGTCNMDYQGTTDNGSRLACNSGVNTISGFLNAELDGGGKIDSDIGTGNVCLGNTASTTDQCDASETVIRSFAGTRQRYIGMASTHLLIDPPLCILLICIDNGYANLKENLRFLHNITLDDATTKDFFLSFQRERVAYPIFDSSAPYDTSGTLAGGSSTYSFPANTGWWMNVTYARVREAYIGTIAAGLPLSALNEPGLDVQDVGLGPTQVPLDNCYGNPGFC